MTKTRTLPVGILARRVRSALRAVRPREAAVRRAGPGGAPPAAPRPTRRFRRSL
jgi:hypothetical protein